MIGILDELIQIDRGHLTAIQSGDADPVGRVIGALQLRRQEQSDVVALDRSDERQRRAGVPSGLVDDRTSGLEVASLLGEPSSRTNKASGTAIWRYAYTKATTKSGAVFLLFGSSSTVQTEGAVFVEFDGDKRVVKTWSER